MNYSRTNRKGSTNKLANRMRLYSILIFFLVRKQKWKTFQYEFDLISMEKSTRVVYMCMCVWRYFIGLIFVFKFLFADFDYQIDQFRNYAYKYYGLVRIQKKCNQIVEKSVCRENWTQNLLWIPNNNVQYSLQFCTWNKWSVFVVKIDSGYNYS